MAYISIALISIGDFCCFFPISNISFFPSMAMNLMNLVTRDGILSLDFRVRLLSCVSSFIRSMS